MNVASSGVRFVLY
jgi:hypothetical protein